MREAELGDDLGEEGTHTSTVALCRQTPQRVRRERMASYGRVLHMGTDRWVPFRRRGCIRGCHHAFTFLQPAISLPRASPTGLVMSARMPRS